MADWYRRINGNNIFDGYKIVNEDFIFNSALEAFKFADYVLLIRINGRDNVSIRHNMGSHADYEFKKWVLQMLEEGLFDGYQYTKSAIMQISWTNFYTPQEVSQKLTSIFRSAGYNI